MDCAPDGVKRSCVVINNQFPGPLIEANFGDMIEIKVTNELDDEGTSIHWHGILQSKYPFMDGVPSVHQCPIIPGGTYTYRFQADLYGTSWYHSHYSAQYAGGAAGPMVIHGPKHAEFDIDMGPIMLSDWYHDSYWSLVNQTMNAPPPGRPMPGNNNLIQGKMQYPCANTTRQCTPNAGISKFQFQSGKKHLLRLVNTGADAMQKFTIDGHSFTVIANDMVPCMPYETDVITLGVGQRADAIVQALDDAEGAFWMRSSTGTDGALSCSSMDGISPDALAAVYYESADETAAPKSTSSLTDAQLYNCANDPLTSTEPYVEIKPSLEVSSTQRVDMTLGNNGTNFLWFMNNVSFRADFSRSLLADAVDQNYDYEEEW